MKQLPLILALVATALAARAEIKPEPLLPDGKARPARSSVLLVGSGLPDATAKKVQEDMADTVTLYQLKEEIRSADEWLALLKTADGKKLKSRTWHALYVSLPDVPADTQKALGDLWEGEIIWAPASPPQEAESMAKSLRSALLKNSTPWAEYPADMKQDPRKLLSEDDLLKSPEKLETVPSKNAMVYRAEEGRWQFNLHSYIAHHQGKFWAIWSSGRVNEDSSSQFIRYATSKDGLTWSESGVVAGDPDGEDGPLRWLASGLYVEDGQLYALGCLNEGSDRKGKIWAGAKLVRLQWTADGWKDLGVFADNCMVYFPPLKVAGRDFFVWRDERAHFFTARSLPGQAQWEVKKHPNFPPDYRMSETSTYADADGTLHLIIRDQGKTKRLYHSLSFDDGDSWTLPVKTNYPDAVSKNMAGRLSNGWFYLINNPSTTVRDPLTISLSRDGWTFGSPKNLRQGAPELRYRGGAKATRSFQYAHAIEHDGKLWVIYATNKEDIEVSAFDLDALIKE